MDLCTAAHYLKQGLAIKREVLIYTIDSDINPPVLVPFTKVVTMDATSHQLFSLEDLLANDWEIVR